VEQTRPFRWDLVRGDRLGSLLDGTDPVDLWYVDELLTCAAKVVARSADGEVHFVGRSADSVYDLLSGCLAETSWSARLHPLPLSFGRDDDPPLEAGEVRQLRRNLAADGLAPHNLARRRRPVNFVDIVYRARTYGKLYGVLRRWIADEREQWDVIRLKLRFVGITARQRTSPNTWRWQQRVDWTSELPAAAIANVSLDPRVWSYLCNDQLKITTRSCPVCGSTTAQSGPRSLRATTSRCRRLLKRLRCTVTA
jgi:hypothetical protein